MWLVKQWGTSSQRLDLCEPSALSCIVSPSDITIAGRKKKKKKNAAPERLPGYPAKIV